VRDYVGIKIALFIYILSFAIGFYINFQRVREPLEMKMSVLANIKYEIHNNSSHFFVYHDNKKFLDFNIDTDSIEEMREAIILARNDMNKMTINLIPVNQAVLWSLIGGASGGVTLKSLVGPVRGGGKIFLNRAVVVILALFSGYFLGSELAEWTSPTLTSKDMRMVLKDPKNWSDLKKLYCANISSYVLSITEKIDNVLIRDSLEQVAAKYFKLSDNAHLTGIEVQEITRLFDSVAKLTSTNKDELYERKSLFYKLVEWVVLPLSFLFFCVVLPVIFLRFQ
jgi:hypothetical protein